MLTLLLVNTLDIDLYPAQFVYGCLYLLFEAYPIVFIEGHGFNSGENGLAFLPLFVGSVISTAIVSDSFPVGICTLLTISPLLEKYRASSMSTPVM